MNTIKWSTFADASVDSFNIYRAITGMTINFPNSLQAGDVLTFSATSPTIQKVAISATSAIAVAASINTQAKGVVATVSQSGTQVFVRCTATLHPKFKLYPCTFLTDIAMLPMIIVPKLAPIFVSNVAAIIPTPSPPDYSFSDLDGSPLDWYYITTVKSGIESLPSIWQRPLITPESLCVVEGRVIDAQNNPIVGAEVKASPAGAVKISDDSGITTEPIRAITDKYGRWSLPLLQCKLMLLEVPVIGYTNTVSIPSTPYALFENLVITNNDYFSPDGETLGLASVGGSSFDGGF